MPSPPARESPPRCCSPQLVVCGAGLAAQAPPPGMAVVPAGEFWMGRTRLWLIDEIGWQICASAPTIARCTA